MMKKNRYRGRGSRVQGCSLGLERLGLETVSGRFFERLGLVSVSASYVSFTTLRGRAFDVF